MSREVFIVAAVRTPIGSFGGSLKSLTATQLGAVAIKGAMDKIQLDANLVDEVYMGSVIQAACTYPTLLAIACRNPCATL